MAVAWLVVGHQVLSLTLIACLPLPLYVIREHPRSPLFTCADKDPERVLRALAHTSATGGSLQSDSIVMHRSPVGVPQPLARTNAGRRCYEYDAMSRESVVFITLPVLTAGDAVLLLSRSSWQRDGTGVEFHSMPTSPAHPALKLLPAYLGVASLDDALRHPRIGRILWLEILVNDSIEWTALPHPLAQDGYETACRWYTRYRTLVSGLVSRAPLPENHSPIDERLHRQLAEALEFAHAHA